MWFKQKVASGEAGSQASTVERGLRRAARQEAYERDAKILADVGGDPYPDLAGFPWNVVVLPVDID